MKNADKIQKQIEAKNDFRHVAREAAAKYIEEKLAQGWQVIRKAQAATGSYYVEFICNENQPVKVFRNSFKFGENHVEKEKIITVDYRDKIVWFKDEIKVGRWSVRFSDHDCNRMCDADEFVKVF